MGWEATNLLTVQAKKVCNFPKQRDGLFVCLLPPHHSLQKHHGDGIGKNPGSGRSGPQSNQTWDMIIMGSSQPQGAEGRNMKSFTVSSISCVHCLCMMCTLSVHDGWLFYCHMHTQVPRSLLIILPSVSTYPPSCSHQNLIKLKKKTNIKRIMLTCSI